MSYDYKQTDPESEPRDGGQFSSMLLPVRTTGGSDTERISSLESTVERLVADMRGHRHTGADLTQRITSSVQVSRYINLRVLDAASDCSVSTVVGGYLEIPLSCDVVEIGAYVDTAGTTGTMTVDVNKNGTTIMSTTKVTIDSAETSSRTGASQAVVTTAHFLAGDRLSVDIDAIHTTPAKGLTVRLTIE